MLKIGHRGAKGYVAENTLESFQKAIDLNVDGIELDVQFSSDGKAVIIHDETIDRTTTGTGFVNNFTSSELKKWNIPTLEEVLDLVDKRCFVNVEIKDFKATNSVIKIVQHYILDKNWSNNLFQISSFDWTILEIISSQNPKLQIGVITGNSIEKAFDFAKKITAHSINPHYHLLNSENVQLLHENKFKIYTWTVNQPEDITFVKSLKIDGIISDFPDRI
jgi:glycerophosphoryl diester phosphodiesterase